MHCPPKQLRYSAVDCLPARRLQCSTSPTVTRGWSALKTDSNVSDRVRRAYADLQAVLRFESICESANVNQKTRGTLHV